MSSVHLNAGSLVVFTVSLFFTEIIMLLYTLMYKNSMLIVKNIKPAQEFLSKKEKRNGLFSKESTQKWFLVESEKNQR